MYRINKLKEDVWECEVTIQDGTERWAEKTKQEAIYSVIRGARSLNGTYIREDDITINEKMPEPPSASVTISREDYELLQKVKGGHKYLLNYDDPRIRYRITKEECETIVKIREGKLTVKEK